jgi:hypothetical protein
MSTPATIASPTVVSIFIITVVLSFARCRDSDFDMGEVDAEFQLASERVKMGNKECVRAG